jgi:hypothetical protein
MITEGSSVTHAQFGSGTVSSINGSSATVIFDSGITKTVPLVSLTTMLFS